MSLIPRVVAGLAVAVGVAGCSLPNVPTGAPATSAPAAPTSTSAASSPTATATAAAVPTGPVTPVPQASGQLTGTQLGQVLLPQSYFPAGFALSSSTAITSGDALGSSPARYDLASVSCADFVNHLGNTGFGETAVAGNSYVGQKQAFDQGVYQFGDPSAAAAFVTGISSVAGRCRSFTATANGATGTFSLKAVAAAPVGGHPSLELIQTGTISGSAVTLDTLFTVSGVDVFIGATVGLGAAAPAGLATQTIVYDLMKRQTAAAELG